MPDYLVELQHVVEAIESRVPYGRFAVRAILSLATLYALLFLVHGLWSEYVWPVAQFTALNAANAVESLRSGNALHFTRPDFLSSENLRWIIGGFIAATLWAFGKRLFDRLSGQIKRLETVVDKYGSIFWTPLGDEEKKMLTFFLAALGTHSVQVQAHENTDCVELAGNIRDCFEKAGWSVRQVPLTGTYSSLGASGFVMTTRPESDGLYKPVLEALIGATRGPIMGIAGGPPSDKDRADITILIGPRRVRYDG